MELTIFSYKLKTKSADSGFVKIKGDLGTIIINEKNIEKMSKLSRR